MVTAMRLGAPALQSPGSCQAACAEHVLPALPRCLHLPATNEGARTPYHGLAPSRRIDSGWLGLLLWQQHVDEVRGAVGVHPHLLQPPQVAQQRQKALAALVQPHRAAGPEV